MTDLREPQPVYPMSQPLSVLGPRASLVGWCWVFSGPKMHQSTCLERVAVCCWPFPKQILLASSEPLQELFPLPGDVCIARLSLLGVHFWHCCPFLHSHSTSWELVQNMSLLLGCWIMGLTSHQLVSSCEVSFQRCLAQEMHRKQQTMKGQPATCRDGGVFHALRRLGVRAGEGVENRVRSQESFVLHLGD